jgi:SRSO17 transposase
MEDGRNFANIERRLLSGDGQAVQQFMSDSPWEAGAVFGQIQADIRARPALQQGGLLILDESADEKAGDDSPGASRQYNGRLGKVDLCQVGVYLTYAHPPLGVWALVDGELFLPAEWFTPDWADRRQVLGLPDERTFASKPDLGWQMIQRAQAQGLPFDQVACDDLYGKSRELRAALDAAHLGYAAEVPADTQVYLHPPRVGIPRKRPKQGRTPTRPKVLSGHVPHEVRAVSGRGSTGWQRLTVRPSERGELVADFAVCPVWTVTPAGQVRAEWLVMRRDTEHRVTYTLLNASPNTPTIALIERSCQRFFTERTFQDGKSELGWADFQARKYRAWEHHTALTAATTWFVAEVKLNWRERYARDPDLLQQLEVELLPALSTANVRDLLQAVLPVPQLTPQQAREVVAAHLVHRARSTGSRLKTQRNLLDSG